MKLTTTLLTLAVAATALAAVIPPAPVQLEAHEPCHPGRECKRDEPISRVYPTDIPSEAASLQAREPAKDRDGWEGKRSADAGHPGWSGKRSAQNGWGGKRSPAEDRDGWEGKRSPAEDRDGWEGKRSAEPAHPGWNGKRSAQRGWEGKRSAQDGWEGKRDADASHPG